MASIVTTRKQETPGGTDRRSYQANPDLTTVSRQDFTFLWLINGKQDEDGRLVKKGDAGLPVALRWTIFFPACPTALTAPKSRST